MSKGRSICNVLKAVRKAVADANGIEYEPRKCDFTGECQGTCPACEAEVRYVEREIAIRRLAGKAVTVAGIAAGALSLTACGNDITDNLGQEQTAVKADTADKVFGLVEEQPSFHGGQTALMKYIKGTVKDPKVVRGIDPELDEEALRLVRDMPKWKPGKMSGKLVEVRYTLPVTFTRDDKQDTIK